MANLKNHLIKICDEIIAENNKDFNLDRFQNTGISNHFLNEKEVQLKIGLELLKNQDLKLNNNLKFEKKISNQELNKNDYLDVFLFHNDKKIGIELKFKTKGFLSNEEKLKIDFNYFYTNQGAETNGHHSFFWDLHRLNSLIEKDEIDEGYQIFITNDSSYWTDKIKDEVRKFTIEVFDGKPHISKEKKSINSNAFKMSQSTPFKKDGMALPNWTSVDDIKGQNDKINPYKLLKNNLQKKVDNGSLLYSTKKIQLKYVVDEKIEWRPDTITHNGIKQKNPAKIKEGKQLFEIKSKKSSKTKAVSKFAYVIIKLKK
jgi:hypothetical protein